MLWGRGLTLNLLWSTTFGGNSNRILKKIKFFASCCWIKLSQTKVVKKFSGKHLWLGRVISQRKFSKHFFQGNISTCFRNLEQIQKPFNFDEDYCDINYLVWAWVASPCSGNLIWILFKVRFPHRAIHSNLPALKRHLYQEQVFS